MSDSEFKIDPIVRCKVIIYMLHAMNVDISAIVALLESEYSDYVFYWGGDERKIRSITYQHVPAKCSLKMV